MNNRLCKCGCGKQVISANFKVKFIHGHNARKNPFVILNHHPCECGCGELVASNRKVVQGHISKQMNAKIFKPFGYKTLVIWESELKNIERITKKIIKFAETDYVR